MEDQEQGEMTHQSESIMTGEREREVIKIDEFRQLEYGYGGVV